MYFILSAFLAFQLTAAPDPSPRQFSTHYRDLGPNGATELLTADRAGNLFIVSTTDPANAPSIQVTKTDAAGKVIATFAFGGSATDSPQTAAIDPMAIW